MAGELDHSESELKILGMRDPNYPGLDLERGRIAIARGKFTEAMVFFDRYLKNTRIRGGADVSRRLPGDDG